MIIRSLCDDKKSNIFVSFSHVSMSLIARQNALSPVMKFRKFAMDEFKIFEDFLDSTYFFHRCNLHLICNEKKNKCKLDNLKMGSQRLEQKKTIKIHLTPSEVKWANRKFNNLINRDTKQHNNGALLKF